MCKIETVIRAPGNCSVLKRDLGNCLSNNYGHNKSVLEVTRGTEQCERKAWISYTLFILLCPSRGTD